MPTYMIGGDGLTYLREAHAVYPWQRTPDGRRTYQQITWKYRLHPLSADGQRGDAAEARLGSGTAASTTTCGWCCWTWIRSAVSQRVLSPAQPPSARLRCRRAGVSCAARPQGAPRSASCSRRARSADLAGDACSGRPGQWRRVGAGPVVRHNQRRHLIRHRGRVREGKTLPVVTIIIHLIFCLMQSVCYNRLSQHRNAALQVRRGREAYGRGHPGVPRLPHRRAGQL